MIRALSSNDSEPVARSEEFVAWDAGRLLVRADYAEAFAKRGWNSAAALLETSQCEVFRELPDRQNGVSVLERSDGRMRRVYWKRHRASHGTPAGLVEADALRWAQEAGVSTPRPVAVGVSRSDGAGSASVLITEELTGFEPADDYWKSRFADHWEVESSERTSLLISLAKAARRFHKAGLFHRDFYWCHFFVQEAASGEPMVALIDLQRVHRPKWTKLWWRIKDVAQFRFSAPFRVTPNEWDVWLATYLGKKQLAAADHLFWRVIGIRAWLYERKERRR